MNTLKNVRVERKLKLKDVAESVGLSAQGLSNYENNLRTPPVDIAHKLALYYNIQMEKLFPLTLEDHDVIISEFSSENENKLGVMPDNLHKVSIFTKLRTGLSPSDGEMLESIDYYLSTSGESSYFGLRIKDDKLSPDFLKNDVLIFEKYNKKTFSDVKKYSIVITTVIDGGTSLFKYFNSGNQIFLSEYGVNNFINADKEVIVDILGVLKQIRRDF
jgi:transcriptional regulator with XRE-family HTH domain